MFCYIFKQAISAMGNSHCLLVLRLEEREGPSAACWSGTKLSRF